MNEWNIQSRASVCQACEKSFADKQAYHTVLFDERQEFRRLDICQQCWEAQFSQGTTERKGFVSHWQGIYLAPPPAPPDAIQKETAETLLRKLIEQNDPKHGPACFILAVMLERKRLLKIKEQFKRDGARVFIYEQPATGDLFTITDPNLQLNQLDEVQRDVASLLEYGLNPPAAAAETAPAASNETSAAETPVENAPATAPIENNPPPTE